ncbi:MAG TPA: DUF3800 domain-containing protein [Candidatus Acidoferrales bacterium]|nr:DUF3800 domain-containing protein [Candidatus Acidoferrales bacterium]
MAIYAFLDESGEYTFHAKSGAYLVYTGVITAIPTLFSHELAKLKYDLLAEGHCLERFHASEDKQSVRDRVFDVLAPSGDFAIHSIVVRKNRINPSLYKYGVYSVAYRTMLKYFVGDRKLPQTHIIVDTVPDKQQQTALVQTLKSRADDAMGAIPFSIDHHSSFAHALLQVADYCGWAVYKKWQSGDTRSYDRIRNKIKNEFDLYKNGDMEYY